MSQNVKPNNFNTVTPDLNTELYTQTGGVNGKFTISDVFDLLPLQATRDEEYFDNFTGTTISLLHDPIFIVVIVNGQVIRRGLNRDYTCTNNIVTFNYNLVDDNIQIIYDY